MVPATASDVLNADGSNLAAVLAQLKAETRSDDRPNGVLSDIAAELNNLIPGVSRLHAELHDASREYRIELTMRDGLPFTSRVVSDGTLRVLALLRDRYGEEAAARFGLGFGAADRAENIRPD